MTFREWLESREFYELAQAYRHAPIAPLSAAGGAFEALKKRLCEEHERPIRAVTGITRVDLWYPAASETVVEIQLQHVRAARDIRIHYDFERDGYVISAQDTRDRVDGDGEPQQWDGLNAYGEVAFVSAWTPDGGADGSEHEASRETPASGDE